MPQHFNTTTSAEKHTQTLIPNVRHIDVQVIRIIESKKNKTQNTTMKRKNNRRTYTYQDMTWV